jgi:hypothetical protein
MVEFFAYEEIRSPIQVNPNIKIQNQNHSDHNQRKNNSENRGAMEFLSHKKVEAEIQARSHQIFCLLLAMTLLRIMLRNRCWATTFNTITTGDVDGWSLWSTPHAPITPTFHQLLCRAPLQRDARNTMGTRGTPEWHPGLVAPVVRGPKWSYCGWGPRALGTPPTHGD